MSTEQRFCSLAWPHPRVMAWLSLLLLLEPAVSAAQNQVELPIPVERHTLDNGLRVVLTPDTSSPLVSILISYDVGSRHETKGRSGFAHLFEHMMFQGSKNIGEMDHFKIINAAGGSVNASTGWDRTNYHETLPSHQLSLGLWLEADRMQNLAVNQESFEKERRVVINEFRENYENQPYGMKRIRLNALAYGDYFPYANSTIGTVTDLNQVSWEDALNFYQSWYAPNNAVLVLAGDFEPTDALRLVQEHFGSIPRRQVTEWQDPGFSGQTEERFEVMEDRLAQLPAFSMVYHIPPSREDDHYALEMLTLILGDGESSRLHRLLVEERQICSLIYAYTDDRRGPDLLTVSGIVAGGHQPAEARELVYQELDRIIRDGVTEREMTKARNRISAYFVFGLQTNLQRARFLALFELFYDDATLLRTELNRYLEVSAPQVQQVAQRYLLATNRTVLDVVPASQHPPRSSVEGPPAGEEERAAASESTSADEAEDSVEGGESQ